MSCVNYLATCSSTEVEIAGLTFTFNSTAVDLFVYSNEKCPLGKLLNVNIMRCCCIQTQPLRILLMKRSIEASVYVVAVDKVLVLHTWA